MTIQEKWTVEEDKHLQKLVKSGQEINSDSLKVQFPGKTKDEIKFRWEKVINPSLIPTKWSKEEDEKIIEWVGKKGPIQWTKLSKEIPGKSNKQCRERWNNYLNPNISQITKQNDLKIDIFTQDINKFNKNSNLLLNQTKNATNQQFNLTSKNNSTLNPDKRTETEIQRVKSTVNHEVLI